ncbi:MAG: SRPBCC family protein [Gammaproteobacteria bacterium]|nr:SRPBCC family protein [Gammaproteobacteria bacterium]
MGYNVSVSKNLSLPRAKVFAALADFGGVQKILGDAVSSCELVGSGIGSVRKIKLAAGGGVDERLEVLHDNTVFAYSIIKNDNGLPVDNYFAVVTLADDGKGGTNATWSSNWTPNGAPEADIKTALEGLYTALLDGIAKAG